MNIRIRREEPRDFPIIRELVEKAFEHAEHADHDEHNLVDRLRQSPVHIPELALVAEVDGEIAGHIMFSRARAGNREVILLAPLAVRPDLHKRGVGTALVLAAHDIARDRGFTWVLVVGHAGYYPRLGYRRAEEFGLSIPLPVEDGSFMAFDLRGKWDRLEGALELPKEFFEK